MARPCTISSPTRPPCINMARRATILTRLTNEKFRKRKDSLLRKGDELSKLCEAGVYILLYHNNRFYVYTSEESPAWPPTPEKIVRLLLELEDLRLRRFKERSHPLPVLRTTAHFSRPKGQASMRALEATNTSEAECVRSYGHSVDPRLLEPETLATHVGH